METGRPMAEAGRGRGMRAGPTRAGSTKAGSNKAGTKASRTAPNELLESAFDRRFYLAKYADVAAAGVDPLQHYLIDGWREGRDPSPQFSTRFYVAEHLKTDADLCPLVHYVNEGRAASLPISESDAYQRYLATRDKVWSAELLELMTMAGIDTGLFAEASFNRFVPMLFSAGDYKARKGIVEDLSFTELLVRYLAFDFPRGMAPGPLFDEAHYVAAAQAAGLPPLSDSPGPFLHWLAHGLPARVAPTPLYSDEDYLALNKDLEGFPGWPFEHFLLHGLREGRQFHGTFQHALPSFGSRLERSRALPDLVARLCAQPGAVEQIADWHRFRGSDAMDDILARARALEPEIGSLKEVHFSLVPPWHEQAYADFSGLRALMPEGPIDSVILMPFCKMGGADNVASVLAHSLGDPARTLVLRTEDSEWSLGHRFPEGIHTIDISARLKPLDAGLRQRMLYELIRAIGPADVFNVNSRLGFEVYERFGKRMSRFTGLHAYYFCADKTPEGHDTGYPVWYFASLIDRMRSALVDSQALADTMTARYSLEGPLREKIRVAHTPAMAELPAEPISVAQIASRPQRRRPALLWAGRIDRQKRFDLVMEIAREMPRVDFLCWGKAVLDAPPDMSKAPPNLTLNPPFKLHEELPLRNCDGWLYTSGWDGIPSILIEIGAMGMPVVASAVGGVPELIDETTGWPVAEDGTVEDYVEAIEAMLSDDADKLKRTSALLERVRVRHGREQFAETIAAVRAGTTDGGADG